MNSLDTLRHLLTLIYLQNVQIPPTFPPQHFFVIDKIFKIGRKSNGMTKWDDNSWQKDFLNMKSHSPSDAKLLMRGVKGLKDAWRLGVLHVEYERLKKKQEEQQQQ